jgi:hypothetical protein
MERTSRPLWLRESCRELPAGRVGKGGYPSSICGSTRGTAVDRSMAVTLAVAWVAVWDAGGGLLKKIKAASADTRITSPMRMAMMILRRSLGGGRESISVFISPYYTGNPFVSGKAAEEWGYYNVVDFVCET